ncbi:MAG: hypothetical protein NDJ72_08290 [Elusimicrobia bacterium]|nr:hypothetical protein [Elusimicrobiota bacterium]
MKTPKRPKLFIRYKNLSGDSKVVRYESTKDVMTVQFADNSVYNYSNQSAGPANIVKMKTLAAAGKGLGTFIESSLKDRFMRKIR